jgi:hypothetical protein
MYSGPSSVSIRFPVESTCVSAGPGAVSACAPAASPAVVRRRGGPAALVRAGGSTSERHPSTIGARWRAPASGQSEVAPALCVTDVTAGLGVVGGACDSLV